MTNRLKFLLLISLTPVLLLFSNVSAGSTVPAGKNPHKKETAFHKDSLHQTAFIQPQADFSVCSNKTDSFYPAKANGNFEPAVVNRDQISPVAKPAFSQDINRCESVSLLLFPYHIFW